MPEINLDALPPVEERDVLWAEVARLRAEVALLRSPGADGCHTNACEWETTSGAYCTCASIAETERMRAERDQYEADACGLLNALEAERCNYATWQERAEKAEAERDRLRTRFTGVAIHANRIASHIWPETPAWEALTDLRAALYAPVQTTTEETNDEA